MRLREILATWCGCKKCHPNHAP